VVPSTCATARSSKWLDGARDCRSSAYRYCGFAVPPWKSDKPRVPAIDVYGSLDCSSRPTSSRGQMISTVPLIRQLVRPNPHDPTGPVEDALLCPTGSTAVRVPCSMPGTRSALPFGEQLSGSSRTFPAIHRRSTSGQTRGWFDTLHGCRRFLSTSPRFEPVSCTRALGDGRAKLVETARAMIPTPSNVFRHGRSDAMRWALLSFDGFARSDIRRSARDGRIRAPRADSLYQWDVYESLFSFLSCVTCLADRRV